MTAPRPDLDALEARLLDAERTDLLVEHGVRHTDIKWIFAAARERDALDAHLAEVSDTYRASAEAFQRALAAERQRAEEAEERLRVDNERMLQYMDRMANWTQAQLREMDALRLELGALDKRHLATIERLRADVARLTQERDEARAESVAVLTAAEARCPCCADTGRCTYPDGTAHPCPTCGTAPEQEPSMASDDVRALAERIARGVPGGALGWDAETFRHVLEQRDALARAVLAQETRPTCATCRWLQPHTAEDPPMCRPTTGTAWESSAT